MSEVEGLTESSEEHIHHAAHSGPKWVSGVALSTAILAALAAIAALLSGSNEGEAALHQQQSSDQWAYYQAKGIKASITEARSDVFVAAGKPADAKLEEKLARYKEEQEKISEKAKDLEGERDRELHSHHIYSKGVTLFQIAIAIGAISVLTKQRRYWAVSLAFGILGLVFLVFGLNAQFGPHAAPEAEHAEHSGH